jgi:hypothetical protein
MFTHARWTIVSLALLWLTLGFSSSIAQTTQTKLYDDFRSKQIDPSKWVGEPASLSPGSDKDRREVSVGLVGEEGHHRLRISQTNYSAITDNNGSSGIGFGLGFATPSQLKAVSFTLAVDEVTVVDCGSNPSFATVGFFGDYFNPAGATNGQTGDIVASIAVTHFSHTGALDVGASVSQCQDTKCNGQSTVSFQDLGPVPAGSTNTLSAAWDQPNHQFIFRLNNDAPVPLPYTLPDSLPPGLADRSFFVFGSVPHCTTKPRPLASIDARFGNVYVNP